MLYKGAFGRLVFLLVAAMLVLLACGDGGDVADPEDSVPPSDSAVASGGQDSDDVETNDVETDGVETDGEDDVGVSDEDAPDEGDEEDEAPAAPQTDPEPELIAISESTLGIGARVPADWVETRTVDNGLGGSLFEATDNQARFTRGESSGLQVFVGIPPFEPTVESVVAGVRFGSPVRKCTAGQPGEQEITLSSGQPALWLDCEEPKRSSILIVGDDPTQPDATVVVVTDPDDPAHDRVIESVSFGESVGGEAVRVTDDSGRLSVEIPPGWDWDSAATAAGQPMVGASLGSPGDALDVPTIQFFTLPVTNDPADALDRLLEAFGFGDACEVLLVEPDTVADISGERADGLLCGPDEFAVAAFVGPVGDGSSDTVVFLMSAEHGTDPSPGAVLATIEIS